MNKEIVISDMFLDIYKNFNVCNQSDKIKQLSRKEILLLLILASDSFLEESTIVIDNFRDFKNELQIIHDSLPDISDDKMEITDVDIISLGDQTGDKFVDTTKIVDIQGNKLPKPLSEEEALIKRREIGINTIIN